MITATDPLRSLTDGRFRFQMALRPGEGGAVFGPTLHHATVMAERSRLLATTPGLYAAARPGLQDALAKTAQLVNQWLAATGTPPVELPPPPADETAGSLTAWCALAGTRWEPDWMILRPDENDIFRLSAGVVCFPSGWALTDKIDRPLEEVHAPVPGLNETLGRQIQTFLLRLKPGAVWLRDNWGLSADSALNHHPSLNLRPLTASARLAETWLRYEEQLLVRLPDSHDVLFGIRVGRVRLPEILPFPEVTRRLRTALESIPEHVAIYKGIDAARPTLLAQLTALMQP